MSRGALSLAAVVLVFCASAALAQPPALERARVAYAAGNLDEARRVLEEAVRQGTQDPGVFLLLGIIERTADRLESAITALQRAQALAPEATPIGVELGVTLARHGDLDQAIGLFRKLLAADPENPGALSGLGFALAWRGRLDEARSIFTTMAAENPDSVAAWTGVGVVERAAFRRKEAEAAYRRVLAIEPGNTEAAEVLAAVRWEGRADVRVLGGVSSEPDTSGRLEARVDMRYAIDQRSMLFAGYQRYGYGAASPITGGGVLVSTRTEDSLEGGMVFRPTSRTAVAASLYTFFSGDVSRAIMWLEAVQALSSRVSVIGNFRPAYSTQEPEWLMAGAVGATVRLARRQQLTGRLLIAGDTDWEPRLTLMADYAAPVTRRLEFRLSAAHSGSDEQYNFTSVNAAATYMLSPSVGLSAEAGHRFETAERSTLMVGLLLRH